MKGQRDALESELNDAMVELIYTDFLLANFDLQTLFLDPWVNTTANMSCFGFKTN